MNTLLILQTGILAIGALLLNSPVALAGNATWLEFTVSGTWNDAVNWSPATVPNGPLDIATFGAYDSVFPVVTLTANTEVNGIVFNASAPGYNIFSNNVTLTISGAGVTNNSGAVKTLIAGGATGVIRFQGSAIAGDGNVGVLAQNGGTAFFTGSSSGGAARMGAASNGIVDISGLTTPGMTAGYILTDDTGANSFRLGSKTLTVGSSNATTTVSGVIADGGVAGGVGGSIVKVGTGTMTYAGASANTYTGTTFVNEGTLVLNKTVEAVRGPLIVGDGVGATGSASVNAIGNPNNIQDSQPVTVNSDGQFSLGPGLLEFISSLTVNQGLVGMAVGGRLRTTGPLTMTGGKILSGGEMSTIALENGTVQVTSASDGTAATIASQVQLTTAHTFVIGDGPGTTDLLISGNIFSSSSTNSIIKSGPGTMVLSGSNSYASSTIAAGTLSISRDANLGTPPTSPTAGNIVIDGGILRTTASFTLTDNRGVTLGAAGGVAEVIAEVELEIRGGIAGTGSLIKTGAGRLIFSGSEANSYTSTTVVNDGSLVLLKSNSPSILGPLIIGDGAGAPSSAEVNVFTSSQVSDAAPVTIKTDGILFISEFASDGIGNLTLEGGSVQIGTVLGNCSLSMNGNLMMSGGTVSGAGTFSLLGSATATSSSDGLAASITSRVNLGGVTRTFTVNDGPGAVDLQISGPINNGGITKLGAGTLALGGVSTYSGPTTIVAGKLLLTGSLMGSTTVVANGATFQGNGTTGTLTINSGATLIPGLSVGTLNTGNLTLDSGSTSFFELLVANVVGGGINDLVNITGNLTLDGTLVVTELPGFGEGMYPLFDYSGTLTDNGMDLQSSFLAAHPGSFISIDAVNTRVNLAVVPEPGVLILALAGGAALSLRRRRDAVPAPKSVE